MADRQTHLDGLRGIAALLVVVSHAIITFDFALYTGRAEDSHGPWDIAISGAPLLLPLAGNLCVCVFFALSGYVLSQSLCKTRLAILPLIIKRYIRFAVPMLAVCLLSWALLSGGCMNNQELSTLTRSSWLQNQMHQAASIENAIAEGGWRGLLHAADFKLSYDSSLWTMPIEFAGSVVLILAFALARRVGADLLNPGLGTLFIFWLLAVIGCTSYLGLFAVGALMSLSGLQRHVSPRTAGMLLFTGLFLGTIPYSVHPWSVVRPFVHWPYSPIPSIPFPYSGLPIFHAIGAIFILAAANSLPQLRRFLERPVVQFLGQISFPLYLVHIPLMMSAGAAIALQLDRYDLPLPWIAALSGVAFVLISLLVASLLLLIAERPSIRWSRGASMAFDRLYRVALAKVRQRVKVYSTGAA